MELIRQVDEVADSKRGQEQDKRAIPTTPFSKLGYSLRVVNQLRKRLKVRHFLVLSALFRASLGRASLVMTCLREGIRLCNLLTTSVTDFHHRLRLFFGKCQKLLSLSTCHRLVSYQQVHHYLVIRVHNRPGRWTLRTPAGLRHIPFLKLRKDFFRQAIRRGNVPVMFHNLLDREQVSTAVGK